MIMQDEFARALSSDSDLDSSSSNGHASGKTEKLKRERPEPQRHARSEGTQDGPQSGVDRGVGDRLHGMKADDLIPPLFVLALLLGLPYVLDLSHVLDPIWSAYLTVQDWTGPILPVFLFEFLFGLGAEIADWRGTIDLPQRTRQRLKAALILTGTLGTVAAFIVNPDAPFGVALHSTALGVGSGLAYHFYQMVRGLWPGI